MKTFSLILLIICISAVSASDKGTQDATGIGTTLDALAVEHKGPESPSYKVLNRTSGLEKRRYENATWAISFGRSRFNVAFAAIQAGFDLAKYFAGGNVEHEKVGKTVPLLAPFTRPPHPPPHRKNGTEDALPRKGGKRPPPGPPAIVVAGFIPKKYKGEPPKPESPHVKIQHFNETIVYVHEFSGWFLTWLLPREVRHTIDALKELKICPGKGIFSVAQYDGPWKFFNRRNEIWWTERPKRHRNDTSVGFEALDVERLFPEEFGSPQVESAALPRDDFVQLPLKTEGSGDSGEYISTGQIVAAA